MIQAGRNFELKIREPMILTKTLCKSNSIDKNVCFLSCIIKNYHKCDSHVCAREEF